MISWPLESHRVCREHGFKGPSRFEQMRREYGSWRAAVMLVESDDLQSGLTWCAEHDLLKQTIERRTSS
jgi:hypothetical protein